MNEGDKMMGRFIIKLKDFYLEWSTVVDAPITYGMTLDELKGHIKEEYGNEGLNELEHRLTRVDTKGTSAHADRNLIDTIWLNQAGPDERPATIVGIYHHYCLNEEWRDEWLIPQEIADLEDDSEGKHHAAAVAGWPD
jgi:hypothetical protein